MNRSRRGRTPLVRAWLAAALSVVALGSLAGGLTLTAASADTAAKAPAPARAPAPRAGAPVILEDLSAGVSDITTISDITTYVGVGGMRYSASGTWFPEAGTCDGFIVSPSASPLPPPGGGNCGNAVGWQRFLPVVKMLGLEQGQSEQEADANRALDYPTGGGPDGSLIDPGDMIRTKSEVPITGGHYYAVTAYSAEATCSGDRPGHISFGGLTLELVVDGVSHTLGGTRNACTDPDATVHDLHYTPTYTIPIWIAHLQSPAMKVSAGSHTAGFAVHSAVDDGYPNISWLDAPGILDVTPSVTTAFSPATITAGETSTLTFTITNTSELGAKSDWSFADQLPPGMTLASSAVGGTCAQQAGAAFVTSATAGGRDITVSGGDLAAGAESCTITVDVTTSHTGTFTHHPSDVTGDLVSGGAGSTLTVKPQPATSISLKGKADTTTLVAGKKITFTYTATNDGDAPLSEVAIHDRLTGSGPHSALSCTPAQPTDLAPGAELVCTGTYRPTKADVAAGSVESRFSVAWTSPQGNHNVVGPVIVRVVADGSPSTDHPSDHDTAGPHESAGPAGPGTTLPNTGAPSMWLAALAAVLLTAGALVLAVGGRRRRHGVQSARGDQTSG